MVFKKANKVPAQLITVDDIATRLSISKRTVWRLEASGKLPSGIRIGKTVRWREIDIEMWIESGCPPRHEMSSL